MVSPFFHFTLGDMFNKQPMIFQSLNYSIEVVNGVVYLIGIAQNQKELDAVIEISKKTYGVTSVISYVRLKDIF